MTQPLAGHSWFLHHDNAPMHTVLCPKVSCNPNSKMVPDLPYSLDLSVADFFLFPKLEVGLKQSQFESAEEIKVKS
jgi:hypothetical protein